MALAQRKMAHWCTCPCAPLCFSEISWLSATFSPPLRRRPRLHKAAPGHAHHRRGGAGAPDQRPDPSVLPSIYPMLKANYGLTFTQVGLITLTFQLTASLLQPWVGYHTDRHPKPWLLPAGTVCTLIGIVMMSVVGSFPLILLAAGLIGIGSSTFHPEASRVARLASGGRFGLARSTFQVGGNAGSAFGPLLAAAIIIPYGQGNVAWFGLFAVFALFVLYRISRWYANHLNLFRLKQGQAATHGLSRGRVTSALVVLGTAGVLQVLLHVQPHQLFHLLPDREVRPVGGQFAAAPVPVSRCGGRGDLLRRAHRRQNRAQGRDLVLDPGRCAVHIALPHVTCSGPLSRAWSSASSPPRAFSAIVVLRPGTGARQRRDDCRGIFRPDVSASVGLARLLLGHLATYTASNTCTSCVRSCRCWRIGDFPATHQKGLITCHYAVSASLHKTSG